MNIDIALRVNANDPGTTAVEAAYIKLVKACARLQREAKDAAFPDPDYLESPEYLATSVNDGAHEILDLAHALLHALEIVRE
ncbi:MAG TPA: hypothetical protein VGG86_20905 [Roseiarcus sp.]|jgi:hypothetical protein